MTVPAEHLMQRAMTALAADDGDGALYAAYRATQTAPERPDAWWVLGQVAAATFDFATAEHAYDEGARRLPPGHPQRALFLVQRAGALFPLGRNADAVAVAREAQSAGVTDTSSLAALGLVFRRAGHETEALPLLQRAAELEPNNPRHLHILADVQSFLGQMEAARRNYEASIALAPSVETYYALSRFGRWTRENNHINALKALTPRTLQQTAYQGYALFKELEDIGDYEDAWSWLVRGAEAQRNLPVTPQTPAWSSTAEAEIVAAWKTYFPQSRFADRSATSVTNPRRMFIIGLPRSGTTLIERILGAHSQVQALGELHAFSAAVKRGSGSNSPALLDTETIVLAAEKSSDVFADLYSRETAHLHDGSAFTIDKLPYNHEYAGLIRLAFPDAVIIHVRRNPMDSLFGAYKLLAPFKYRWSYSQDDLADHYRNYRELMAHWKDCLGDGLIEVSLEAVIADPEREIRLLLAACDLPFEPACLSPHETEGAVATASSVQVRRPINADGVGAWKRYADHLEPLRQRLMAAGFIDPEGRAL